MRYTCRQPGGASSAPGATATTDDVARREIAAFSRVLLRVQARRAAALASQGRPFPASGDTLVAQIEPGSELNDQLTPTENAHSARSAHESSHGVQPLGSTALFLRTCEGLANP